jgi:CAAX protease family protein
MSRARAGPRPRRSVLRLRGLSLLGPAIAAVVVTAWTMGRPGLRDLGARLVRWRVALRWWLVAVSPAAFLTLGLVAMRVAGKPLPAVGDFRAVQRDAGHRSGGRVLAHHVRGQPGRGDRVARVRAASTATPVQPADRDADLGAVLVLVAPAAVRRHRHLPGLRPGRLPGHVSGPDLRGDCAHLDNRSGGSILLVIVWHGVYNFVGATQAATGTLAAIVSTLIMVQGIILVVVELRARRRGLPSVLEPP